MERRRGPRVILPPERESREGGHGLRLDRRAWLTMVGAGSAAALGGCAWAFGPEAADVELTRHVIGVPSLAPALEGLRVALVTDVHLPANGPAARHALALLARERPEVVVLTGDMVERPAGLGDLKEFAAAARGSMATFATLGNWERVGGIAPTTLDALYRDAGVTLLVNARALVGAGGARLAIGGLDDPVRGAPDAGPILRDGRSADAEFWLVHAPGYVDRLPPGARGHVAAVLAGHTHGGQIRLPFVPPMLPACSGGYVAGWYREAPLPLYVSRGVGTTQVRARFRCPPEVALFTLRRA